MNNLEENLYNDFWDWLDSISIKYKNYEIKNAIIAHKYIKLVGFMHINNVNHFNLRKTLSSIKWKLILHLLMNKIPKRNKNLLIRKNYDSSYVLRNKNLYAVNYSPNDLSCFLHIALLAKKDKCSLVITVRDDVYNYFNEIEIPVILLDVSIPWRNENDLKIHVPLTSLENKLLLSLDLTSLVLLSKSASLIDLLDIVTNENGLPKTLITLQDIIAFDSVFASYFKGKVPTVTLQHGSAVMKNNQNDLWKFLISDWMIVFGARQAEILKFAGVDSKKIKILGSAKYDIYINKIDGKLKNNRNKRLLLTIQKIMFSKENVEIIFDFIKNLLSSKEDYTVFIRFHPSIKKKNRKIFVQQLKKLNLNYGVKIDISDIKDPLEDISKSEIILITSSTLGMESILLKKPVIEYLSSGKDNNKNFGDYRDFVLHASNGKDAKLLIIKLLNNKDFYNEVVEKQNNFVNSEIMPPPAIPRILDFIYNLGN